MKIQGKAIHNFSKLELKMREVKFKWTFCKTFFVNICKSHQSWQKQFSGCIAFWNYLFLYLKSFMIY